MCFCITSDKSIQVFDNRTKRVRAFKTSFKERNGYWCLVKEAEHTQSKADFINKMNIALKEANETEYWLMLLKDSDYPDEKSFNSIHLDSVELIKLLASIVKSSKEKLKK